MLQTCHTCCEERLAESVIVKAGLEPEDLVACFCRCMQSEFLWENNQLLMFVMVMIAGSDAHWSCPRTRLW